MTQNTRSKMALLFAFGTILIVAITAVANAHHRSAERAQLLADIHRIELPTANYALETTGLSSTPKETAWRAYCEHQRVTLIDEARASAAQ
ncbi:MAG: hypothetical protein ABR526_04305 [Chthoniobacterales bacterium]